MSLLAKVGSFAANTSTGDQAVTGVGFTPKAIIFFGSAVTATGFSAGAQAFFGFTAGASESFCGTLASDDNANPSNSAKRAAAKCIAMLTSGATNSADAEADLKTFDADGFTITWTDAPAAAYLVNYLALGGDTLTNAKAGEYAAPAGTGDASVTGVGFQPDCLITFGPAINAGAPQTAVNAQNMFGLATATQEATCRFADADNQTTTNVNSEQEGAQFKAWAGTFESTLSTMDADGFTENWTTTLSGRRFYYLALKGGLYQVGAETQATSATTKDTATSGMTPAALLAFSWNLAASSSQSVLVGKSSVGASDGTNHRGGWIEAVDARATASVGTNTNKLYSQTNILTMATSDSTTDAAADVAFASEKFTMNWTTADATAREFIYLAVGNTPEAPQSPPYANVTVGLSF
jgi:hypothetical protein